MPPTNPGRRRALTDAAIDLLATSGVHGVTHRAVEQAAGLPPGTASNYFRSREALLVAAARRIVDLHHADTDGFAPRAGTAEAPAASAPAGTSAQLAELLAESLFAAATTLRNRYLAVFELQMEATRRPALAAVLTALQDSSFRLTADQHAALGLAIPAERIPILVALYGGTLFALVAAPPGHVSRELVDDLAWAIVRGALPDLDVGA
ncbi:transcriptional regulator, TetR family [Micromonospora citrea]|uniref:Transcriptional regulator, TetR family n=1 Tax=Micromonospora citrea TaxID=47855 RepID=A0A1C6VY90_9ACTN|nr:TetR/AcrR family transcriptional regulator [Micromonospora citrea]SCL71167.1 transcriptional regulator, TetR family [Micromonospora citrea]